MPEAVSAVDLEREKEKLIQNYERMLKDDYARQVDLAFQFDVDQRLHIPEIVVSGDGSAQLKSNSE